MTDLHLYLVHTHTGERFRLAKGVNGLSVPQRFDGYPEASVDSATAFVVDLDGFFKECGYPGYGDFEVHFVNETKDAPSEPSALFALTDAHVTALEKAIRAEGYDILVDPETGEVKLTRAESST